MAQLHYLTGKPAYREKAEAILEAFSGELQRNFFPLSTLLNAGETLQSAQQLVIVGPPDSPAVGALLHAGYESSAPDRLLTVVDPQSALPPGHPAHGKGQVDGKPTVYLCRGTTCSLPITDPTELTAALSS
jgi:hypothetical protein